jgi:replication-associated recombination protein RarA
MKRKDSSHPLENPNPNLIPLITPPPKTKKKVKYEELDCPLINNISDLIRIAKTTKLYKNIDNIMLWRISDILEELNNLIGMEELKESIFFQVIYYLQKMHTRNQNEEYLHTAIMGPPGSGKTSVARIIGSLYQKMDILSNTGIFKIAYRDDLIAEYLGQTAVKTRKLLNSCLGGILFIDEVYSLGQKDKKDSFSKEALDTLTGFLSEHKNDFCCIIAGYEKDIEECFFGTNKGLKRRFPWCHSIKPYSSSDLSKIMIKMIKDMNWITYIEESELIVLFDKNKEHFKYYGGDIETFLTKCKMCHSKRVFCLDSSVKYILTKEDLESAINMILKAKNNLEKDDDEKSIPFGMYS